MNLKDPELTIGQSVKFSPDSHAEYDAQVITCEWNAKALDWEYRLRAGTYEFGPYTYVALSFLMR